MKRLSALWILFFCFSSNGQTSIPSYSISVTFQKTTNIIFPYRIEKADIGSADVIGHKDAILENVLFLKAGRKGFVPTNLSVYTSDGKFYSFIVQYRDNPDTLNISFRNNPDLIITTSDSINDARLDSDALKIENIASFMHKRTSEQEMKLVLKGIYIKDRQMWFKLEIRNNSQVDYQPEYTRFTIRDKHAAKRTAEQESAVLASWQSPAKMIPGKTNVRYLFAFPAFTLSRQKKMLIQVSEKNGGRTLTLTIPSKSLLRSRLIK